MRAELDDLVSRLSYMENGGVLTAEQIKKSVDRLNLLRRQAYSVLKHQVSPRSVLQFILGELNKIDFLEYKDTLLNYMELGLPLTIGLYVRHSIVPKEVKNVSPGYTATLYTDESQSIILHVDTSELTHKCDFNIKLMCDVTREFPDHDFVVYYPEGIMFRTPNYKDKGAGLNTLYEELLLPKHPSTFKVSSKLELVTCLEE